jgi:hypothetical protein
MLQASGSLGQLGQTADSGFSKLNNAIVAASLRSSGWGKLADDWNTNVFEPRAWKSAIPPLWASLLNDYWERYTKLYLADPNRGGLPDPLSIAPTGLTGALREFYAPALSALVSLLPSEPTYDVPIGPVPESGPVKRLVADLQKILINLGWRSTTIPRPGAKDFGLFGPKTAGAWGESARARGLSPQFDRVSPTEAMVDVKTFTTLAKGVSIPIKTNGGKPPVPVPVPPVPVVEEGMSPWAILLVAVGVAGLGYTLTRRKRRSPMLTPAEAT